MSNIEKKFLSMIDKHFTSIVFVGVFILGFLIRYSFRDFVSGDAKLFLLPWYDIIKNNGALGGLGTQVGDYNIPYQTIIALFSYLPFKPLLDYKILSCLFDIILSVTVGLICYDISGKNKKWFLVGFALIYLSPLVIINSSLWAQCDSIYTTFVVASLYLLYKNKFLQAFVFLGLAFSFKLQTVFIVPFFLYVYFVKKKFSILNFLIIIAMMVLTGLPGIVMGRKVTDIFSIYSSQTSTYQQISLNYPSFWNIIKGVSNADFYEVLKMPAIITTVLALLLFFYYLLTHNRKLTGETFFNIAFISVFICVIFLPAMHERYGYIYEVLGVILLVKNRKTIYLYIPLILISLTTYSNFLFGTGMSVYTLAVPNIMILIGYFKILFLDKKEIGNKDY